MLIYSFQSVCIYKERERGRERERERENAVDKCAAFTPHPKPPQTSGGPTRPRGFDSPSCPEKEERENDREGERERGSLRDEMAHASVKYFPFALKPCKSKPLLPLLGPTCWVWFA